MTIGNISRIWARQNRRYPTLPPTPGHRRQDLIDPNELAKDYVLGCGPGVSLEMVYDYLGRIKRLTTELAIDVEIDPF